MEFVAVKRSRNRKKKRNLQKRRREKIKLEVISEIRRRNNVLLAKQKVVSSTMQADSFWKNYTAAQEWQKRHSVTWWRSRCLALEYENQVLRDKVRALAYQCERQSSSTVQNNSSTGIEDQEEVPEETGSDEGSESFEFQINQNMINFLEQSIKHKMELKKMRESELEAAAQEEKDNEDSAITGGAAWVAERAAGAKLLYGESSPRILAMETALQTTVNRHKDKAKPQFWPVIPLKP